MKACWFEPGDNPAAAMKLFTVLLGLLLAQSSSVEVSLSGRVETLGSRAPVPYAEVVLAPVGGSLEAYRTTSADAAGQFVFRNVRPGSFRVHAERQGYLRGEAGSRTVGIVGSPVSVVQGQAPPAVVVTLTPTGAIAGRILSDDGPVRGALVRALRVVFRDGDRGTEMAAAASADDRGEYRLFGLAPGAYLVDAVRPARARIEGNEYVVPLIASNANGNRREMRVPLAQALLEGTVDPAAYESGTRLPSLYPGTMEEEAAIPIDIAPGATVPGVDIVIAHVPSVTVRGRVIAGAGTMTESVGIGVRRLGSSSSDSRGSPPAIPVRQEGNGAFVLPSVPSGRYELTARTGGNSGTQFGRAVVEVGDRDVADVQIVMTPGLRVSGHLVVDGVRGRGGDPPLMVQLVARQNGQSARQIPDDGSFVFENVAPQDYWLRIQSQGRTLSPVSIRFGADAPTDGIVTVSPDKQAEQLVIAVTLRTGDVDVAVVDRNQRPVQGVTVALVPDPARRRYSGLFRTASSGADGRIRFNGIEPGRYTLLSGDVAPADWQNPDVLQRFERTGIAVQVEASGRQNVTLVAP